MGSVKEYQLIGCLGKHGPYSFFRSIKIGTRTLPLTSFFPVRPWPDSAMLSIAEVQLLWTDKTEGFCSLKLYFLPENTPEGRRQHHGEDEVLALQDKVIIRALDLSSWLVSDSDWDWGFLIPGSNQAKPFTTPLAKSFQSDKFQKKDKIYDFVEPGSSRVVVMNYERYIRLRSVLKRLEGSSDMSNWLTHPLVLALGNVNVGPGCKVLFTKEVFDYPELEDHELLCNHLAPKLKGRPRKKNRRRNPSFGSESNESEVSSSGSSKSSVLAKAAIETATSVSNGIATTVEKSEEKEAIPESVKILSPESPEPTVSIKMQKGERVISPPSTIPPRQVDAFKIKSDGLPAPDNGKIPHKTFDNNSSLPPKKKSVIGIGRMNLEDSIAASTVVKTENVVEEKKIAAQILGPELSQLAEKLEKSNAIKILPVRSSVITKTESTAAAVAAGTTKGQNVGHNSGWHNKSGVKSSADVIPKPAHIVDNYLLPKDSSYRNQPSFVGRRVAIIPEPDDLIERLALYNRLRSGPFASTNGSQVFGDPCKQRNELLQGSRPGSSQMNKNQSFGKPVKRTAEEVIDFSVNRNKKARVEVPPNSSHHSGSSSNFVNGDAAAAGLLDLSVKGHGSFKNFSDIPPPNAMNQMGVRLTSEVTLYPAGSRPHQPGGEKRFYSNSVAPPTQSRAPSKKVSAAPTTNGQSHDVHSMIDVQNKRSVPSTRFVDNRNLNEQQHRGRNPIEQHSAGLRTAHSQPRFGDPSPKLSMQTSVDRLPQPGHVHGTAAKPVASKGSFRQIENGREAARQTDLSRVMDSDKLPPPPSIPTDTFSHFLSLQSLNPFYLNLCQRFMNPMGAAAPNPETLQDWQRYQEMMKAWSYGPTTPK